MTVDSKKSTERKPSESGDPATTRWQRIRRPLFIAIGIAVVYIVYAFGFQVTDVTLEEIEDETRQAQLVRLIRQIFSPDLVTLAREETTLSHAVLVPCRIDGPAIPSPDTTGPYIRVTPSCIDPDQEVLVEGFGVLPRSRGIIELVPESDFDITIILGPFEADEQGNFTETVVMPDRPSDNLQALQAVVRVEVGSWFNRVEVWEDDNANGVVDEGEMKLSPRFSDNAVLTFERIIETVFLALLATTAGTIVAIPVSFLAARNLMKEIRIPLTTVTLAIIGMPLGAALGWGAAGVARSVGAALDASLLSLAGVLVLPVALIAAVRWAIPSTEIEPPQPAQRIGHAAVLLLSAFAGLLWLDLLGNLAVLVGNWLESNLGPVGFLGAFIATLGDILGNVITLFAVLAGAGILAIGAGRLGRFIADRLPQTPRTTLDVLLAGGAGAVISGSLGLAVGWIYEIDSLQRTLLIPLAVGFVLGAAFGLYATRKIAVGAGMSVYYVSRTLFNTLRSIEPLVMTIVFVVWVGIGPFAGALALSVHTAASLAKLYSEQVENIMPGPLEAVKATGASRLQTVVYAVVPQIVAPYISFTMYRWDINVRMSTIIGFAGGGGIGQLLQQNTQLGQYGKAATQMLAIAIVVASMDYISSRLRERYV